MEPVAKRPRSEFDGLDPHGDADSRRFKHADGKDVGHQPVSSGGKPKPCMKYFSTSGCPFGESCHFLHHVPGGLSSLGLAPAVSLSASSASALQKKAADPGTVTVNGYKTKLCNRFSTAEGCRFGDRCHFAHGESDLRSSSNMPRGNNRRPIVNGPIGAAPPGFSNDSSQFPNPAGNGSSFAPQGYAQPAPQSYMQPPPQGYGQPNQSAQFPNSTGNPAPAWHDPQSYPQPDQHGVPANAGSGAYSSGPVDNVPVY